jgi:hypothetical protein
MILFPLAESPLTFQSPHRVALSSNHNPRESIATPEAMAFDGVERGVTPRLAKHDPDVAVTARS